MFYTFVKHGSNGDRLFLHIFPFNTATLTGYSHAFQSARPLATGLPFRCLTTPCHTRGHVSFVLEGEAGLGRAQTYQSQKMICFFSWNCSHTLLSRWFMKGRCCELSIIFAYSIHHRVFISSHRHRCVHQNHESRCFLTKIIYNHFEGSFFSLLVRHHCM